MSTLDLDVTRPPVLVKLYRNVHDVTATSTNNLLRQNVAARPIVLCVYVLEVIGLVDARADELSTTLALDRQQQGRRASTVNRHVPGN